VRDLPRQLLVPLAVLLGASVLLIWTGLARQDSKGTLIAIAGGVALASALAFLGAVIVRSRSGIVPAEDPQLRARLDTWRNSPASVILIATGVALWGYDLVAAVMRGAFGLAALYAILFASFVWRLLRVLRRRRTGST
jgi:hypothetical protein